MKPYSGASDISRITLLKDFLAAYQQKDIDSIAEILSEQVLLRDWNLQVIGKGAVLAEFAKNFADASSLRITINNVYFSKSAVAAEIEIDIATLEQIRVVDILGFNGENQIDSIISYRGL